MKSYYQYSHESIQSYLWQDGSTDSTFVVTEAGTYNVTVTNAKGCAATDEIVISDPSITPEFSASDVCFTEASTFTLTSAVDNVDSIAWDFGDGNSQVGERLTTVTYTYSAPGTYEVAVTTYILGTGSSHSDTIEIMELPIVDLGSDQVLAPGEEIILSALDNDIVSYEWQDGSTEPTFTATAAGTYSVIVMNAFGCTSMDQILVSSEFANIPNAFTPDGDGINDVWVIHGIETYPNSILRLFDRQGNFLKEWSNYANNWDGSIRNSASKRGTYFYILWHEGQMIAKGSVSVIK